MISFQGVKGLGGEFPPLFCLGRPNIHRIPAATLGAGHCFLRGEGRNFDAFAAAFVVFDCDDVGGWQGDGHFNLRFVLRCMNNNGNIAGMS